MQITGSEFWKEIPNAYVHIVLVTSTLQYYLQFFWHTGTGLNFVGYLRVICTLHPFNLHFNRFQRIFDHTLQTIYFKFDSCFQIINWWFINVRLIPVIFYRSNGQWTLQIEIKNTWCTTEINWEQYLITTKKRAYMMVQYRNKFWFWFLINLCETLLIPFILNTKLKKFILMQPPPYRFSRVWSRAEDIWQRVLLLKNSNISMT